MEVGRSKRIAKNTMILYVQMLLGMLVGLYTSRVILNVLGVEDFGIYNVVGGVVVMFSVLNNSMSSSTSRYLTFELGKGNLKQLKKVFGSSLFIHLGMGLIVVLIAEIVGLWFLQNKMQIPITRMGAAVWVFHTTVFSLFLTIICVPYRATLIAHERFLILALISISELLFRLGAVFLLLVLNYDKLIVYAFLTCIIQVLLSLGYIFYCRKFFKETKGELRISKRLSKEMFSFAGWSLFGDSAVMLMTQGVNVLLNLFFGATVNAARGVAVQVQGMVGRFISSFQTAVNPQLTKSYAEGDLDYMHRLIFTSSKYSFCLFFLLGLPVFLDTNFILVLWLKIVPEHTINFIRLLLVISLVDCLANPLIVAAKATGRIRRYQTILGTILLFIVPISYLFLSLGFSAEYVFVVHLFIVVIGQVVRVLLIRPMISLSIKEYFIKVIFRSSIVFLLAPIIPVLFIYNMDESFLRFALISFTSLVSVSFVLLSVGMDKIERDLVLKNIIARFK